MPISDYLKSLRTAVGSELLLVPSVTGIVFDAAGGVLLVKHSETDAWVAPGGSIEPNESPANAVVREMWEETGLLVEPVRILGVYGGPEFQITYRNGDQVTYVMTVFECRVLTGALQVDGEETLQARFFRSDQVESLTLSPWLRVVLADVFRKEDKACFQPPSWQPDH